MSGNGAPNALASLGLKPQPRPRMSRPPLIVSSVDGHLRRHGRVAERRVDDPEADVDPWDRGRDRGVEGQAVEA